MTKNDIALKIARRLGRPNNARYISIIEEMADDVIEDVGSRYRGRWRWLGKKSSTITQFVADDHDYALDSDFLYLFGVYIDGDTDRDVRVYSPRQFYRRHPRPQDVPASSTPTECCINIENELIIYPILNTTVTVEVWYFAKIPETIASSSDLDSVYGIPIEAQRAIYRGLLAEAFTHEGARESVIMFQTAKFENAIKQLWRKNRQYGGDMPQMQSYLAHGARHKPASHDPSVYYSGED